MYSWIPAGALPLTAIVRSWLYWRYERTGVLTPEVTLSNQGGTYVKLPDRTLYFTFYRQQRPLDGQWDGCMSTDLFGDHGILRKYTDWALVSAHNILDLPKTAQDWLMNTKWKRGNTKFMGDSGGAQLRFGALDFVDPHEIINVYNKMGVDYGMALDIPPRPIDQDDDDVLKMCRKAMKVNNEIFIRNKRPELKLLNVAQGFTLEQVWEWMQDIARPEMYGWAIGGSFGKYDSLRKAFMVHTKAECSRNHLHLLGISGKRLVPALAMLGTVIPNFSTDSTTWLQGVRARKIFFQNLDAKFWGADIGRKALGNLPPLSPLPCSCEICSIIRYWDVFSLPPENQTPGWLVAHNMIMYLEHINMWNRLAHSMSHGDFLELVTSVYGTSSPATQCTQFVLCLIEEGLEAANRRFRMVLTDHTNLVSMGRPLFGQNALSLEMQKANEATNKKKTKVAAHLRGSVKVTDDMAVDAEEQGTVNLTAWHTLPSARNIAQNFLDRVTVERTMTDAEFKVFCAARDKAQMAQDREDAQDTEDQLKASKAADKLLPTNGEGLVAWSAEEVVSIYPHPLSSTFPSGVSIIEEDVPVATVDDDLDGMDF